MAVMPDGRVVLSDLGRRGYHLFGADREFDRMVRMLADELDVPTVVVKRVPA